jgi:hypothetical protein
LQKFIHSMSERGCLCIALIHFIEFIADNNPALRRAAGEALGYLCNSEGDALTTSLIKSISDLVCTFIW